MLGLRGDNPFTLVANFISQMFPPEPTFTEKDIGNLSGKVYIVTGANTGLGKEIANILYSKDAKVYVAARSKEKALRAIESIQDAHPKSQGTLIFLPLDLADLSTIKSSAESFLANETRLDVLFNNAGVMRPPQGSVTAQGYELQMGVNNIGTFMFTKLLTPMLIRTAKSNADTSSVRVIWVASSAVEAPPVPVGGVDMSNIDYHREASPFAKYAISKAGNYLHGAEYARLHKADGIVSLPLNPGHLDSDLWRGFNQGFISIVKRLLFYPPVYGAYTQLWAAFSPEITIERTGEWVVPWGRIMEPRKHLYLASKPVSEGGTGNGQKFWEWNEEQVRPYL